MKDYKEICNKIYQELSDYEKSQCSIELIETVILFKSHVEEHFDNNYASKVVDVVAFWREGFDDYVDINIVVENINAELEKEKIFVEKDLLKSIINLNKRYNKNDY